MNQRRRELLIALGSTSMASLAGCSSSGETETTPQSDSSTRTTTVTPTATLTTTVTEPPTGQVSTVDAGDGDSGDKFGSSVALSADGTTAIIGAPYDEDPNGENAGGAYVFAASDGSWRQQAKLTPDDGDSNDLFGTSVSVSGDGTTAFISANSDEDPNGKQSGSAYVFSGSGDTWRQQTKLTPDDGHSDDLFGFPLEISNDGTTAIIGASNDDTSNGEESGSAYVFEQSEGTWNQTAKLLPDDGDRDDAFGVSAGLSGDGNTAIIGAMLDEDPDGKYSGSAYVFEAADGSWRQQAKLTPDDGGVLKRFGYPVAMSNDGTNAIIGNLHDTPNTRSKNSGSAYIFQESDGSWDQQAKLIPDEGNEDHEFEGDRFGGAVAMAGDGTTAIITAKNEDIQHDERQNEYEVGSAYVFERSEGSWRQQNKFVPENGDSFDEFGKSVDIASDGGTAIIGAHKDNPDGGDAGAAYIFK